MDLRLQSVSERIGLLSGIDPQDVYASIGAGTLHWSDDEEV